jgi:hypothetical protein
VIGYETATEGRHLLTDEQFRALLLHLDGEPADAIESADI